MTGTAWFDTLTAGAFALLAVVAAGRVAFGPRSAAARADAAAHAVMAAGMSAMALGASDPVPTGVWTAAFVAVGTASTAVLLRSAWWRPGPPIRGPGPPAAGSRRRTVPAGAAHHLAASALMVVALAGGHSAHTDGPTDDTFPHATHAAHASHAAQTSDGDGDGTAEPAGQLATAVPGPLMAGAGVGFLGYSGWLALGLVRSRRPEACTCAGRPTRIDALCTVAMSAGMGLMAVTMA